MSKNWVLIQKLKQKKPEMLLEAKMTKLKLFCLGHIMRRQGSLEKTTGIKHKEASKEED